MSGVWTISANELRAGLRNRMVAATILVLGALALALALFGTTAVGETRVDNLGVITVSLTSLSIYFIPLLALVLSFDSVIGEAERGTLPLLLACPLSRGRLLWGKYTGQLAILCIAIVIGYGSVGLYLALDGPSAPGARWGYGLMMASSALLGAVFLALGMLISIVVRERATAAGAAVVTWLLVVVIYDLALLALLVADTEHRVGGVLLGALVAINPVDAYRLLNLGNVESAAAATTGMAGLDVGPAWVMLAAMLAWLVALMPLNTWLFRRMEV